jgi:hypothetical protein
MKMPTWKVSESRDIWMMGGWDFIASFLSAVRFIGKKMQSLLQE